MSEAERTEAQAAHWLLRREEPNWSKAEQAQLDSWLEESMAHKAAYWRLHHYWRNADRLRALGAVGDDGPPWRRDPSTPNWWQRAAIAASLVAVIGLLAAMSGLMRDHRPVVAEATFTTSVGGRRIVPLSDGSKIELNTATLLRTNMSDEMREVWLDSGEAYFEVAPRAGRPFIVHAGSRKVTVLGTKFAVRREGDRVTVSVVEGRVQVDESTSENVPTAIIKAGSMAIAYGPSTLLMTQSGQQVESGLAWRSGMLTFDQATLSDVAEEFNRYNRKRMEIVGAEAANIRIGGTFRASNADAFGMLLREAYGLKVTSDAEVIRISG